MAFGKKKEVEETKVKKEKKIKEPAFYTSATNLPTINYKVYYMSFMEKLLYFVAAFAVGALVGYLFYGGIGKDEYGNPTQLTYILNIVISCGVGLAAGIMFLPLRTKQIINSRQAQLKKQFRDFLDGLTTSLGAGNNMMQSIDALYDDMSIQYEEGAFIIGELKVLKSGLQNNVALEEMLLDFGKRSGIQDIMNFAQVFEISHRTGANIQNVVRNTHAVLSEKMDIMEDIETIVSSNKMEQGIMIAMPIMLVGAIKVMSPEFAANFVTPSGLIATTVAIVCFVGAYYLGKIILDIKL